MPKKRKPGRPKGAKSMEPRKGSMRAYIIKRYDAGGFASTIEIAELLRWMGHTCTTNHVCAALNRWRPDWYEKMHGPLTGRDDVKARQGVAGDEVV